MKSSRTRNSLWYSSMTYTCQNESPTPTPQAITIPVDSPAPTAAPTSLRLPNSSHALAATKIQSAYRAHLTRSLFRTVCSVNSRADILQRRIQRQDTVDALRRDEKERLRLDEELMGLLLALDGVKGFDEGVRTARRKVSRRIVGLQEIVDSVCGSRSGWEEDKGSDFSYWWEEVEGMEEQVCRETGGHEMEEFCARYLGFRCLQRFLHDA